MAVSREGGKGIARYKGVGIEEMSFLLGIGVKRET